MAVMSNENAVTQKLIAWACETYGFEPKQFKACQEDFQSGGFKLAFTPRRFPPDVVALANKIHDVMNDEFRGEVVRAAVPELSTNAAALADMILNPKLHVIEIDYLRLQQIIKL